MLIDEPQIKLEEDNINKSSDQPAGKNSWVTISYPDTNTLYFVKFITGSNNCYLDVIFELG